MVKYKDNGHMEDIGRDRIVTVEQDDEDGETHLVLTQNNNSKSTTKTQQTGVVHNAEEAA